VPQFAALDAAAQKRGTKRWKKRVVTGVKRVKEARQRWTFGTTVWTAVDRLIHLGFPEHLLGHHYGGKEYKGKRKYSPSQQDLMDIQGKTEWLSHMAGIPPVPQ